LEQLVNWYIGQGVHGLFAVCQSSEMFFLSLEERIEITRFVMKTTAGRVPVIASGHISNQIEDQIHELQAVAELGVDAVVLVTNRMAKADENDEIWKKNTDTILTALPNVTFGMYECPYPYKRLVNPELLEWCESTGRFSFLKDTCCDLDEMKARLAVLKKGKLKLFNANAATLLESLKLGASGFSGVMANFHPDLYVWLYEHWSTKPDKAESLQDFLGFASCMETQYYPVNAKYSIQLQGVSIDLKTRTKDEQNFAAHQKMAVEQLQRHAAFVRANF
jgi:4-hydroxy-tetrahydrodipicolinate synthase